MAPLGRLKRRSEFLRVAAARRKWAAPGLVLQAMRRSGEGDPSIRVGFTASKKVGIAVERNRAKRRLRAAATALLPRLGAPGTDYVLIARLDTGKRPFAALLDDLETAIRRVGERDSRRQDRAASAD